jgi:hypothetical protein
VKIVEDMTGYYKSRNERDLNRLHSRSAVPSVLDPSGKTLVPIDEIRG